jgi:hypothetical protein
VGHERGVDDDAVGVFDAQLTVELDGAVHLAAHRPPQVDRQRPHLVHGPLPAANADAGLLLDLPGEPFEE